MAGFTANEKTVLQLWIDPQLSAIKFKISFIQNVVRMEYLTAKLNKAKQKTIRNWENLYDSIAGRFV